MECTSYILTMSRMNHFNKTWQKKYCLTLPIAGLGALLPRDGEAATDVGVALDLGRDMADGGTGSKNQIQNQQTAMHSFSLKSFWSFCSFSHPNMTDVQ